MSRIKSILEHIKSDCEDIATFIEGLTEQDFDKNKLVRNAVGMSLINIGELVKALPVEFKEEHAQLPWRKISGMRDMAAHKYNTLDTHAVWSVAKNRIPEILSFIELYIG